MTGLVSLPMYDWPEVSDALDRLWGSIRQSLDELGVDAPVERARPDESITHWRNPSLLLSQTCGLPLRRHLLDAVMVIGAFDHRLPATDPGDYHSVVIVRDDHPAKTIGEIQQATAAVNTADSQSGHAALRHALIGHAGSITRVVSSGSHRRSVQFVAAGQADIASIDAVSWELARSHEPAAAGCRVLTRTPPTPGLPLITARCNADLLPHLRLATAHGIDLLDPADRDRLHLHALVGRSADDYALLEQRWSEADEAGVPVLL